MARMEAAQAGQRASPRLLPTSGNCVYISLLSLAKLTSRRTKHELERLEGWQNRQAEAPSSDDYDDDSGDEKRELKKVDKRAARNTDFFLAALGLAPDPARKPKKKRRDG